jgi:hypothetical protein
VAWSNAGSCSSFAAAAIAVSGYCGRGCREAARWASTRAARPRYRQTPEGRRGVADRQAAFRERRRREQKVTDQGLEKVAPLVELKLPAQQVAMVVAAGAGEEESFAIDLGCDSSPADRNSGSGAGGSGRDAFEGETSGGADESAGGVGASRSAGALAGRSDPRCALCGARRRHVRHEFLSRIGRRSRPGAALRDRGGRGRGPPATA